MPHAPYHLSLPWPDNRDTPFFKISSRPYSFFLDTSDKQTDRICPSRYSIWAANPLCILEDHGPHTYLNTFDKKKRIRQTLLDFIQKDLKNHSLQDPERESLPFLGGWIGFLGYEWRAKRDLGLPRPRLRSQRPDALFGLFDTCIIHDHEQRRLHLLSWGWTFKERRFNKTLAQQRVDNLQEALFAKKNLVASIHPPSPLLVLPPLSTNFPKEDYIQAVKKIKRYIHAGDCYQVNMSQRWTLPIHQTPVLIYQKLRQVSPSPYAAYLHCGAYQILSSSPECFLKIDGQEIQTHPIKGTRRRSLDFLEDEQLKEELWLSEKDQAELLMITDLERNDLGRVCQAGTVRVKELRRIESYAQVHHSVSVIQGLLRDNISHTEALCQSFPGGSITGAPKIRAMQIIQELEKDPRHIYTGSIGYFSYHQKSQFNIAIRTLTIEDHRAVFHAGGGIVADSDPEEEYEETLIKARGLQLALTQHGLSKASSF